MQGKVDIWSSVADMMTGLMLVFMLITVLYMSRVDQKQKELQDAGKEYQGVQDKIQVELEKEFGNELPKWGAELLPDNTIRFNRPDVLFGEGSSALQPKFKEILQDFLPQYFSIMMEHKDSIQQISIEGHTSSGWSGGSSLRERYINNVRLSQERARSIQVYAFDLSQLSSEQKIWMTTSVQSVGMAFSRPVYGEDGTEDEDASRRVEFRVIPKSEEKLEAILSTVNKNLFSSNKDREAKAAAEAAARSESFNASPTTFASPTAPATMTTSTATATIVTPQSSGQ